MPARRWLLLCFLGLLWAGVARAQEPGVPRRFDPHGSGLRDAEGAFLDALFARTERVARWNAEVLRWLWSEGRDGMGAASHRARVEELLSELDELDAAPGALEVRDLIVRAIRGQLHFLAAWARAVEAGAPFDSQLHSEFGFHDELHSSESALFGAYQKLRRLHPEARPEDRDAFREQLMALRLIR